MYYYGFWALFIGCLSILFGAFVVICLVVWLWSLL